MSVAHATSARKLLSPKSLVVDPLAQARIAQRGFQVATLAALGWFALGLESILRPNPMDLRDSLFHIPWIFIIVTFWFIHRVQGASAVRWERGTFLVLIASMLAVTLGSSGLLLVRPACNRSRSLGACSCG
jgi:hypothetical protein